jgi:excisionase family DNA binding protein
VILVTRTQHDQIPVVDLISVPDAARRLGLHPDTLYRLCRTGQFPPAIQIGARWRVSVPKLERYLHGDFVES